MIGHNCARRLAAAASFWALGALLGSAYAETLSVGVIGPMTGPGAPYGMAARVGAELAAEDVNAKGGLDVAGKKYQVQVIAYDDQYKAAEAVAAYSRLVNQGVKYILVTTSASAIAVKERVEDDKIVCITSAAAKAAIDDNTKYMVRLLSQPDIFIPGYVAWMRDHLKERRIVVVNPNDETGWALSKLAIDEYKKNGFEMLGSELYERSARDFMPLLTKLTALRPELIDLASSAPSTAGLIVRQARELGFKGRFVQTGGSGWAEIVDAAGKEASDGLVNIVWTDTSNPGYQRLAAAYRKRINQRPNETIAPYYDGWRVLLSAIEKAGDVNNTTKVVASFKDVLPMMSVQGTEMSWGKQQVLTTQFVTVLENGQPVIKGTVK